MMKSKLVKNALIILLDLIVTGAALWLAVEAIREASRGDMLSGLLLALSIPFIAMANAVWLQIRVVPRLTKLTKRPLRMDLAVTPISVPRFLLRNILPPLGWALLPSMVSQPLMFIALIFESKDEWRVVLIMIVIVLAPLSISIWGLTDSLVRLCSSSERQARAYLLPIAWSALAVGAPIGFIIVLTRFVHTINENFASFILIFGSASGTIIAFIFTAKSFRTACKRYFDLES